MVVRILRALFGSAPASKSGPNALRIMRSSMLAGGNENGPPRSPWSTRYVNKQVGRVTEGPSPLTTSRDVDRLLEMMARWWEGWSLARIARAGGISRQRVATILRSVGCTRKLWCLSDHGRPDSPRRALPQRVARAREALLHPLARRLTVRQRAALAWQAQGLILADSGGAR